MYDRRVSTSSSDSDESFSGQLLQPQNDFEKFALAVQERWKRFKTWLVKRGPEKELTPQERKIAVLAEIIQTYRAVDAAPLAGENASPVDWIDRWPFDFLVSFVIILNVVVIGLEIDLGERDGDGRAWYWIVISWLFCVFFIVEILLKTCYHGKFWVFEDLWNFISLGIAFLAVVNAILSLAGIQSELRLFYLARVAWAIRLLCGLDSERGLKELRMVIQGLLGSISMLFWTVMLLLFFIYVFAVFATSNIGRSDDFDDLAKITHGFDRDALFGSVGRSMYTLLQCTTRDGWSSYIARFVIEQNLWLSLSFLVFLMVLTYGILNLVVSVIVEQTLNAARNNAARNRSRDEKKKKAELEGLRRIFELVDEDGNGDLTATEFMNAVKDNDEVLWRMRELDLPIDDASRLFSVIDGDGSRSLSLQEFLEGCTKLKGPARSRDMLAITAQADTLQSKLDELGEQVKEAERMLDALDTVSVRLQQRFNPSMRSARVKHVHSLGAFAPAVPLQDVKLHTQIGVDLAAGNRPLIPKMEDLPNILV